MKRTVLIHSVLASVVPVFARDGIGARMTTEKKGLEGENVKMVGLHAHQEPHCRASQRE
jgi:hypothetical protein